MARLLGLPDEILLIVTEALLALDKVMGNKHTTLRSFALVCQRTATLVRPVRIRNIELDLRSYRLWVEPEDGPKYVNNIQDVAHTMHFFINHPEFLHQVQTVDIRWDMIDHNVLIDVFLCLISSSMSLHTLALMLPDQAYFQEMEMLMRPRRESFTRLRTLKLSVHEGELSAKCLTSLLTTFLNVTHLEVPFTEIDVAAQQSDSSLSDRLSEHGTLKLESLIANPKRPIALVDILQLIVPRAPHLNTICTSLSEPRFWPDPDLSNTTRDPRYLSYDTTLKLSPSKIGQLLSPVCETLRNLSIASAVLHPNPSSLPFVGTSPHVHDGSKIDLSSFTKISKLALSSLFFFDTHNSAAAEYETQRNCLDIWRLLPPNIEEFTLYFEHGQGIFVNQEDLSRMWYEEDLGSSELFLVHWRQRVYDQINDDRPAALQWLFEIVQSKAEGHFPLLKSLHVQEYDCCPWREFKSIDIAELYPKLVNSDMCVSIKIQAPSTMHDGCVGLLRSLGLGGQIDTSFEMKLQQSKECKKKYRKLPPEIQRS